MGEAKHTPGTMMIAEKLEECPNCHEVKRWLYDAQICSVCSHGTKVNNGIDDVSFTPGPWWASYMAPHNMLIRAPNGQTICDIRLGTADYSKQVANARLMAAAPDLLAAEELQQAAELIWSNCPECQETQSWPELCERCFESADKARVTRMNAIAKARGESE